MNSSYLECKTSERNLSDLLCGDIKGDEMKISTNLEWIICHNKNNNSLHCYIVAPKSVHICILQSVQYKILKITNYFNIGCSFVDKKNDSYNKMRVKQKKILCQ